MLYLYSCLSLFSIPVSWHTMCKIVQRNFDPFRYSARQINYRYILILGHFPTSSQRWKFITKTIKSLNSQQWMSLTGKWSFCVSTETLINDSSMEDFVGMKRIFPLCTSASWDPTIFPTRIPPSFRYRGYSLHWHRKERNIQCVSLPEATVYTQRQHWAFIVASKSNITSLRTFSQFSSTRWQVWTVLF